MQPIFGYVLDVLGLKVGYAIFGGRKKLQEALAKNENPDVYYAQPGCKVAVCSGRPAGSGTTPDPASGQLDV